MLGLALIVLLFAFAVIGRFFAGWNDAFPLSAPPSMPPDGDWIFGTDSDGRDLFAVIVYGTLLTAKIGVIAGCLGLGIGTTLAFVAAYHGGWLDAVMRIAVDVLLTIPTLLVLVVIASVIHTQREHHHHGHHHRPARLARAGEANPLPGPGDA